MIEKRMAMPTHHTYYLQQMGIDIWKLRSKEISPSVTLDKLAQCVAACTRCPLHQSRTQAVFSRGNPQAKLMIVGEAPGFHEDQQGQVFVGKAGKLLNQMLHSISLSEQDVYIANILKCRPPDNRDPQSNEIEQCSPYLAEQIKIVQPQLLLAVGRFAGQYLTQQPLGTLSQLRHKIHMYASIPVVVSYHPAYLLRNPEEKKKAYQDLQLIHTLLEKKIARDSQ
jgi:uracil-DNA glycosylase